MPVSPCTLRRTGLKVSARLWHSLRRHTLRISHGSPNCLSPKNLACGSTKLLVAPRLEEICHGSSCSTHFKCSLLGGNLFFDDGKSGCLVQKHHRSRDIH